MRLRPAVRRAAARLTSFAGDGRRPGLRILTYHRVHPAHPKDRLSVHPEAFQAQMEELAASHAVVALEEALPALRGDRAFPANAVAITFDDGYRDNFTFALPVLDRLGLRATFFLATGLVGRAGTLDRYVGCCHDDGMLDWAQVGEMLARGHALGGHGRLHLELTGLPPEEARAEVEGCRHDIRSRTAASSRFFCYPRGREDAMVRRTVAAAGFEAACTVQPGANTAGVDLLGLLRTEVSGADGLRDFRLKLCGGFDGGHRLLQRAGRAWRAA